MSALVALDALAVVAAPADAASVPSAVTLAMTICATAAAQGCPLRARGGVLDFEGEPSPALREAFARWPAVVAGCLGWAVPLRRVSDRPPVALASWTCWTWRAS